MHDTGDDPPRPPAADASGDAPVEDHRNIDPNDFAREVELRPLTLDDFDALVALQRACFPDLEPWERDEVESQLRTWPESQLGVFVDGRLVASAAHLIVDYGDYSRWSDYLEMSDQGYIRNHDPDGDTLYGIEIQVHPDCRGMRLARRLYNARKELCRTHNLARIVIGGRMPGYAAHQHELSAREYVEEVMARNLYDPVLTSQLANGFQLQQLVPDYMPSDEDSAGWATCLEWPNLDYIPAKSRRTRRAVQPVRTSLVQWQMRRIQRFEDFEQQARFFVDTAADYESDFVLFPELFTLQLLSLVEAGRSGQAARRLAEFTPRYLELFTHLAVRFNINIIGGSQFTLEGDDLYNIAYLFRRDGSIETQKKIHVTPSEAKWWGIQGGDDVRAFDTDCGRIGVLICYDVEFPELVRVLADDGVGLLFVPYNTSDRYGHQRVRTCAQARCIENHMFAVTSGCVGNLPFVENADTHYARSAVLTPSDLAFARDGIAIEAESDVETVLAHDLDLEALRRHRRTGTVQNWNDRRTDLYRVRWNGRSPREI
ncbi:MAG: GNAT family N-acetyltransferase [Alphaproteobacteria bacterium]|nr:GNAT family N-acetyltransferase [Alphaproteobacteria bacterium]